MTYSQFRKLIDTRIPSAAQDTVLDLFIQYSFKLKLTRNRSTKSGDYRNHPSGNHIITINEGLNQYSFLITLIHEMAHRVISEWFKKKVKPHGPEWKKAFRQLMQPFLRPHIFPPELLSLLVIHMKNPKASTYSDKRLFKALRKFDLSNGMIMLEELPVGSHFQMNGALYRKEKENRTRALCIKMTTGRRYLISGVAEVEPVYSSSV